MQGPAAAAAAVLASTNDPARRRSYKISGRCRHRNMGDQTQTFDLDRKEGTAIVPAAYSRRHNCDTTSKQQSYSIASIC